MPKKRHAPETFNEHLGAEIEARFSKRGMDQRDMAVALGWAFSTSGRKIRGDTAISVTELLEVAHYLGVPAHEIVDVTLRDFGGIEKLMSEVRPMNEIPGNEADQVEVPEDIEEQYLKGDVDLAAEQRSEESNADEQF